MVGEEASVHCGVWVVVQLDLYYKILMDSICLDFRTIAECCDVYVPWQQVAGEPSLPSRALL